MAKSRISRLSASILSRSHDNPCESTLFRDVSFSQNKSSRVVRFTDKKKKNASN